MSFLKITDPSKRAAMVDEYLKLKKSIQQNSLSEKLGDSDLQRDLIKLYKPITESQAGIAKELSDTSTALKALPESISSTLQAIMPPPDPFSQYPSIEAFEPKSQGLEELIQKYGALAAKYLHLYAEPKNNKVVDTNYGIYSKGAMFHIGNSPTTIQNNDVTVGGKTYAGTPGLWELLTKNIPDKLIYTDDDLKNYEDILVETNAMPQEERPSYPKDNKSKKWEKIVRFIWFSTKVRKDITDRKAEREAEREAARKTDTPPGTTGEAARKADTPPGTTGKTKDKTTIATGTTGKAPGTTGKTKDKPNIAFGTKLKTPETTGKGVAPIILPSDPNELVKMLSLRMSAYEAGNTGAGNEAVAICDELFRQGAIDKKTYKEHMKRLNAV